MTSLTGHTYASPCYIHFKFFTSKCDVHKFVDPIPMTITELQSILALLLVLIFAIHIAFNCFKPYRRNHFISAY